MKLVYSFLTGEQREVEVSKALYDALQELDRQEYNNERRESRRHVSLDMLAEQGVPLAGTANVEQLVEALMLAEQLAKALEKLLPAQRDLVRTVFFEGQSIASIARSEGVNPATISHRLGRIYKRLKVFLK